MTGTRWVALAAVAGFAPAAAARAQESVRIAVVAEDGGRVHGDLYGRGSRGVVLAHGGRFAKEAWAPQARELAEAGFRVLAIDFRGYGESTGPGAEDPMSAPLEMDVLAAVRHLHTLGAAAVAVVGASLGGAAAATAAALAAPGEIDRLVLLAASGAAPLGSVAARKLFIVARGDTTAAGVPRLVGIQAQYDAAAEPKELLVLDGAAHAQALFATDQSERLMRELIRFLSAP